MEAGLQSQSTSSWGADSGRGPKGTLRVRTTIPNWGDEQTAIAGFDGDRPSGVSLHPGESPDWVR